MNEKNDIMNIINITPASLDDVEKIFDLQIKCYPLYYLESIESLAGKIEKYHSLSFVAKVDKTILGYIISYPEKPKYVSTLNEIAKKSVPKNPDIYSLWYVHDLAIHPLFNGKNIGRSLYLTALNEAKKLNLTHSRLVAVQNADTFWAKLGYKKIRKPNSPKKYGDEAVIMEKDL